METQKVCQQLSISESSLRRRLIEENTKFQTILDDIRFGLALSQVQQTKLPIYQIALNCGYQSFSHFTERFHQRFNVAPTKLRETVNESR